MSFVTRLIRELQRPASAVATLTRMARGASDVRKWSDTDNLQQEWDERTKHLATFIPAGSAVLEFGAARLVLREMLDPTCTYTPSDLVARSDDTFVLDLNVAPLRDPPAHDVAVFSGVLEYIHDLPHLFAWLHAHSPRVVTSYAVNDVPDHQSRYKRLKHSWVNSYDRAAIETLFTEAGYDIDETGARGRQHLYSLIRR